MSAPLTASLTFTLLLFVAASWRVGPGDSDNRWSFQALMMGALVVSLGFALMNLLRRTDELLPRDRGVCATPPEGV